jgi:hypothetical protein
MLARVLAVILLLTQWGPEAMSADTRIQVIRDDSPAARQIADQLGREFGRLGLSASDVVVSERIHADLRRDDVRVTIALGPNAWQAARALGRPMVVALIGRATLDEQPWQPGEKGGAILLDQPAERWAALLQVAFPDRPNVALLTGMGQPRIGRTFERKFQERRLTLTEDVVSSRDALVTRLEHILPRNGILLALPDPLVHNRGTIQPLLLTTYRAGVPVAAYSEAYLNAGATIALYSTPAQIATQVIEEVQLLLEGKAVAAIQSPRYFTVGVNRAVARSLGLAIAPDAELQERLHAGD